MNSTKLWMTAHNPSCFGMPISGHAFAVTACAAEVKSAVATSLVLRDRLVIAGTNGAVKADRGLAQAYFPGTNAWSPPTC